MAAGLRRVISTQFTLPFDYSATFCRHFSVELASVVLPRIDAGCYHSLHTLYQAPSVSTGFRTPRNQYRGPHAKRKALALRTRPL